MRPTGLDEQLRQHFDHMHARGKIIVEYIWVGGSGDDLRSKTRVLDCKPVSVDDLPIVKFDGTLTDQVTYLLILWVVAAKSSPRCLPLSTIRRQIFALRRLLERLPACTQSPEQWSQASIVIVLPPRPMDNVYFVLSYWLNLHEISFFYRSISRRRSHLGAL